jgi:arylsulfatase A
VDSFSILPCCAARTPGTHPPLRHPPLHQRPLRDPQGDWKFIAAKGSGGWSKGGDGKPSQLYNMATDRKEQNNLVGKEARYRRRTHQLLETAIANGRTTPGAKQENDTEVVIWKDKVEGRKKK